jgi:hypothetical protein
MAVILNSTKSTAGGPYVYYEVSAEEVAGTRTADSVQIKWGARGHLANDDSTLGTGGGYGIIGHLKINGTEVSSITIKGTGTQWKGKSWKPYVYNTFTLTGLSATQTLISSITFNATRTSNSSSSAGYMTAKNCSDVTITKGFQKSSFESGATSGILGTGQTIQIKSVSDSFTHQLRLKIGNDTYDIDVSDFTTSGLYKNISWTPSYNYANYNTDGNTVYGQLVLTTSGGGTTDTTTSDIALTIPDNSTTKSGISISTSDSTNLLATYDKYVQNKSVLVITPTFTSKYNSWARKYYYEIKANDDSGTILESGDGNSNDSNKFYWTPSYVGTVYIKITLTDSRYFVSTNDATIDTAAYNPPSSSRFSCERDANTSSTINCYIKANGENVNNKYANSVTYKLYYKKTSSNTWSEYGNVGTGYSIDLTNPPVKITGTDKSSSYDIKLTAWDSFTNETQIATDKTPPAFTLMNFNTSGKAMAIGKVSEAGANQELLEIGMTTEITPPTNVYSGLTINSSNRNEGSIAYNNQDKTKSYVFGYGTGGFDGMGLWSHETGKNTMTINKNGVAAVAQSFKIPVNSNNGYGLVDHADNSIIKDWNNGTITMDATGGDLFLGFQNTNSVNIFNGKAYFNSAGGFHAKTIQQQIVSNGTGGTSGVYVKLCNMTFGFHNQGEFANFRIYVGDGNNGRDNQNAFIDLTMQLGWTGNNDGRLGCNWELHPLNTNFDLNNVNIIVIANSNINYDIYLWTDKYYCVPNYTYDCSSNVIITNDGTTSTIYPSGTQCDIRGEVIGNTAQIGDTSTLDMAHHFQIGEILICFGIRNVHSVANSTATDTVGFGAYFRYPPIVNVTAMTGGPNTYEKGAGVTNITTDRFDLTHYRTDNTTTSYQWIAIGLRA